MSIYKTLALTLISASFVSCTSSGTSSSCLGLNLGGNWSGTFFNGDIAFAQLNLSLTHAIDEPDSGAFRSGTVTGTLGASGNSCITGGSVTGTVTGSNVQLEVSQTNETSGTLTLTANATNNGMLGNWVNSATVSTTTVTSADGTDETVSGPDCNLSGRWSASR